MNRKNRFTLQNYNFFCIYQNFFVPLRKIMTKQKVYHIIEWVIAIVGCGYLAYRLAVYDDYAGLWAALCGMGWKEYGALVLCVALMPVNMGLEAWRWKTLWNYELRITNYELMTFREAQRQVYYSKLAGLVTPWRLGEYPARGVLMGEGHSAVSYQPSDVSNQKSLWARVLSMGAVGSATMTAAIVIGGMVGVVLLVGLDELVVLDQLGNSYWILIGAVATVLIVALVWAPKLLRRWATVSHKLVMVSIGQSLVRLVCWCGQLILVLYALGAISIQPSAFSLPFIYYLLVTVTPNVPIAEAGVRGAWAIVVFGSMNAALAGVLLWVINTLLPCLIWPFIRKNER